jgi:DNA ligase-1
MDKKELVFVGGGSSKFWNIELSGSSHTVHYGRIGMDGQAKTKDFATEEKARASFLKLVKAKQKKGYVESGQEFSGSAEAPKTAAVNSDEVTDLADGESLEMQGSAARPYVLRNVGGVYSCTCPAWRNQSLGIEQRTCKHLRLLRGDEAEKTRVGELSGRSPKEPVEGPGVLLAQSWDGELDLTGWWLSEKLDGVRAYWDGEKILSRAGNVFHAPDWFLESLPSEPLDGELFGGRKKFQDTVSIVRRMDKSDLWKKLQFVLFDAPDHEGTFEQRLARCGEVAEKIGSPYYRALEHQECLGEAHLREELARVEALGGEGLMARKPGSVYQRSRSFTLLKIKSFLDAEAIIVGYQAGTGRHKGRMGSLRVELPNGVQFSVGTGFSDKQRENPPAVGEVICFRYQELSRDGVPRFPSYAGMRIDAQWP